MNVAKLREQESFENFNINVKDLVDKVCIGPQANVMEELNRFNLEYGSSLALTKRFNFKPGTYKQLKELYANEVLRWDVRPRGLKSIFERISRFRWKGQNLKRSIMHLDEHLASLRNNGTIWQDNTEDITEELERLKDHIRKEVALASKHYESMTCDTRVSGFIVNPRNSRYYPERSTFTPVDNPAITDFNLFFLIKFNGGIMRHNQLISNGITTTDIPIPGDTYIIISLKLISVLSNAWKKEYSKLNSNPGDSYSNMPFKMEPIYVSSNGQHPYISGNIDSISWNINDGDVEHNTNACTGNMQTDIRKAFYNGKIYLGITHLYNWLHNYYVPQTYPINRIVKLYRFGMPKPLLELKDGEVLNELKERNAERCRYVNLIPEAANIFSRTEREYGSGFTISTLKRFEYFNKYDFNQAPCHNCILVDKCNKLKDLTLVMLDDLTEENEAILGVTMEYNELLTIHYGDSTIEYVEDLLRISDNSVTFLEELITENLEYLMYIGQRYNVNNQKANMGVDVRNIFRQLKSLSADTVELLVEADDYTSSSLDFAILEYKRSIREKALAAEVDIEEVAHNISQEEIDGMFRDNPIETEESLDEVFAEPTHMEEVTPEEATLRWATRTGGAHNL